LKHAGTGVKRMPSEMIAAAPVEQAARRGTDAPVLVRKARIADVPAMHSIINHYAEKQLMLPKAHLQLYETLRDYSVAASPEDDSNVLGCGSLHIYWEDLAEIRAVAVLPGLALKGVGSHLVEALIEEGRSYGLEQIFVFTYVPAFFGRFGFVKVEHRSMPLKVFNECFHCPKFNTCDELAMVLHL
jgi:amino-acid N-acetyltransferase